VVRIHQRAPSKQLKTQRLEGHITLSDRPAAGSQYASRMWEGFSGVEDAERGAS
jgi:hypothetical protein